MMSQRILTDQEVHGWYFDESAARELAQALYSENLLILISYYASRYTYIAGPRVHS
jgi:hypothetical protein